MISIGLDTEVEVLTGLRDQELVDRGDGRLNLDRAERLLQRAVRRCVGSSSNLNL